MTEFDKTKIYYIRGNKDLLLLYRDRINQLVNYAHTIYEPDALTNPDSIYIIKPIDDSFIVKEISYKPVIDAIINDPNSIEIHAYIGTLSEDNTIVVTNRKYQPGVRVFIRNLDLDIWTNKNYTVGTISKTVIKDNCLYYHINYNGLYKEDDIKPFTNPKFKIGDIVMIKHHNCERYIPIYKISAYKYSEGINRYKLELVHEPYRISDNVDEITENEIRPVTIKTYKDFINIYRPYDSFLRTFETLIGISTDKQKQIRSAYMIEVLLPFYGGIINYNDNHISSIGDEKPNDYYRIVINNNEIVIEPTCIKTTPLTFKSKALANDFLSNNKDLVIDYYNFKTKD